VSLGVRRAARKAQKPVSDMTDDEVWEGWADGLQTTPNGTLTWFFSMDAGNFGAYLGRRASAPPNPCLQRSWAELLSLVHRR